MKISILHVFPSLRIVHCLRPREYILFIQSAVTSIVRVSGLYNMWMGFECLSLLDQCLNTAGKCKDYILSE